MVQARDPPLFERPVPRPGPPNTWLSAMAALRRSFSVVHTAPHLREFHQTNGGAGPHPLPCVFAVCGVTPFCGWECDLPALLGICIVVSSRTASLTTATRNASNPSAHTNSHTVQIVGLHWTRLFVGLCHKKTGTQGPFFRSNAQRPPPTPSQAPWVFKVRTAKGQQTLQRRTAPGTPSSATCSFEQGSRIDAPDKG